MRKTASSRLPYTKWGLADTPRKTENLELPSTVSPLYALIRALLNVVPSKTSSGNLLLDTQWGDRNLVDENGHGLGDESLVDTIYYKWSTQTAAKIGSDSDNCSTPITKI